IEIVPGTSTRLDLTLGVLAVELPEITVTAHQVDTRSTQKEQHLTAASLHDLPVDDLTHAVGTKAGIVIVGNEIHVRGSRGSEVKVLNADVDVSNPATGQNPNVATLAIAGVEILSGG